MTTTAEPLPGVVDAVAGPLSHALREGSRRDHETAETAPFLRDLFGVGVAPARYAGYLQRLLPVYAAIEDLVRAAPSDHLVAGFDDPLLDRTAALRADLDHWAPGATASSSPAVRAYVDRLHAAARTPTLLLAHHYTRYLGDLAGGQAVGAVLARRHDLSRGGAAFYAFPGIDRPKRYRDAYKVRLDDLRLSGRDRGALVAEVRTVFGLSLELLREV